MIHSFYKRKGCIYNIQGDVMKKIIICFITIILLAIICLFTYEFIIIPKQNTQETQNQSTNIGENVTSKTNEENIIVEMPKKEDTNITMSVIGDIMCHNSQYIDAFNSETYDFSYVFEDIKDYINSADIAIGNLETTFAGAKKGYSNYPRFNTPEQLAKNLKDFGIDDKFKEALAFAILGFCTLEHKENNIPTCTGAKKRVIMGIVAHGDTGN